jgi:hypothetical protein
MESNYDPNTDYQAKLQDAGVPVEKTETGFKLGSRNEKKFWQASEYEPHVPVIDEALDKDICTICWDDLDNPRGTHLQRVEFRKVGTSGTHAFETYLCHREYATHAEAWTIVQTDHPKDASEAYLTRNGFKDREGNWWMLWHNYHPTNEKAREYIATDAQERLTDRDWNNETVFVGQL